MQLKKIFIIRKIYTKKIMGFVKKVKQGEIDDIFDFILLKYIQKFLTKNE